MNDTQRKPAHQRAEVIWIAPLPPGLRLMLLALNRRADQFGKGNINKQQLCRDTGYSEPLATKLLSNLQNDGLIGVKWQTVNSGVQWTYDIRFSAIAAYRKKEVK